MSEPSQRVDGPAGPGEAAPTVTNVDLRTSGAEAMTSSPEELERLKEILESSGNYRVLRRSGATRVFTPTDSAAVDGLHRGVYLDVETTGLDSSDKIIELGLVVFEYDATGTVYRVVDELDEFEDPGRPLPQAIVELTGITDEQVRGRSISDTEVARVAAGADLVIAHNAGFDRPIVEKRFPFFKAAAWACSVMDVDWSRAGIRNRKLEYLAMMRGFYFDSHRAINDCLAGVELLSSALAPEAEETALANLLANARREGVRLWAESSPFESKDLLKSRKYRWNATAKTWWRDLFADEHDAELDWLAGSVYPQRRALPYLRVDATLRYSSRLPGAPPRDALRK